MSCGERTVGRFWHSPGPEGKREHDEASGQEPERLPRRPRRPRERQAGVSATPERAASPVRGDGAEVVPGRRGGRGRYRRWLRRHRGCASDRRTCDGRCRATRHEREPSAPGGHWGGRHARFTVRIEILDDRHKDGFPTTSARRAAVRPALRSVAARSVWITGSPRIGSRAGPRRRRSRESADSRPRSADRFRRRAPGARSHHPSS